MKKINFIESLYSEEGHYVDDIAKYEFLKDTYELHYHVNGRISGKNKKLLKNFIIHEYDCNGNGIIDQIIFLKKVTKKISNDEFNFIMSIKYISLFLYLSFFTSFKFYLLIHFFPTIRQGLYRSILKNIWKKSNALFVLDEPVKINLEKKLDISKKIYVIHSRDVYKDHYKKVKNKNKLSLLVIGAMNQYKEVDDLLSLLCKNSYENIDFKFYAKGINRYLEKYDVDNLKKLNSLDIKDRYFDRDEYEKFLEESDFVYIAYTKDYGIRFSGILFDALNKGCQIVCNNNELFKSYVDKYYAGYIYNTKQELHIILTNLKTLEINRTIYSDYSKKERERLFIKYLENHYKLKG